MAEHTIYYRNQPRIISAYAVAGPKEGAGPIGRHVQKVLEDDKFGEKTYEKAECKILKTAIEGAIASAKIEIQDVGALFSGDLLNQIISASFAAREFDMPFVGLYSACSTMGESMMVSAAFLDSKQLRYAVSATGSHFSSAERQYRYPLELGCTRPPQSQWTVTGAGACVLSVVGNGPRITAATIGRVVDFGVTDANNMGAAMAPAASNTLWMHFKETGRMPEDYDLIVTGDLGVLGSKLVKELVWEKGYDISKNHVDCGELIYAIKEQEFQGGSGAGCSAVTFCSYLYPKLCDGSLKRILFMPTGALLSTVSTQQGESIPCIAHAVVIESAVK